MLAIRNEITAQFKFSSRLSTIIGQHCPKYRCMFGVWQQSSIQAHSFLYYCRTLVYWWIHLKQSVEQLGSRRLHSVTLSLTGKRNSIQACTCSECLLFWLDTYIHTYIHVWNNTNTPVIALEAENNQCAERLEKHNNVTQDYVVA
jgi:hypothetical protein